MIAVARWVFETPPKITWNRYLAVLGSFSQILDSFITLTEFCKTENLPFETKIASTKEERIDLKNDGWNCWGKDGQDWYFIKPRIC